MTNKNDDKTDEVSQTPTTLSDDDIKTERLTGRRSFLRKLGVGLLGITTIGASQTISRARAVDSDENDSGGDSDGQDGGGEPPTHHDFPKKENDGDEGFIRFRLRSQKLTGNCACGVEIFEASWNVDLPDRHR